MSLEELRCPDSETQGKGKLAMVGPVFSVLTLSFLPLSLLWFGPILPPFLSSFLLFYPLSSFSILFSSFSILFPPFLPSILFSYPLSSFSIIFPPFLSSFPILFSPFLLPTIPPFFHSPFLRILLILFSSSFRPSFLPSSPYFLHHSVSQLSLHFV